LTNRITDKDVVNVGLLKAIKKSKGIYNLSTIVGIHPQRIYVVIRREQIPPLLAIRIHQAFNITFDDLGYGWPIRDGKTNWGGDGPPWGRTTSG